MSDQFYVQHTTVAVAVRNIMRTANKTAAMCTAECVTNTRNGIVMMLIETIQASHCG